MVCLKALVVTVLFQGLCGARVNTSSQDLTTDKFLEVTRKVTGAQNKVWEEANDEGTAVGERINDSRSSVGIVVIADHLFRKRYRTHLVSLDCYAKRHGYELHVFGSSQQPRRCSGIKDFFFVKHCMVAEFLRAQPDGYVALTLDADVAAVTLNRSLDHWLIRDFDLQFYIRDGLREVAAGAYLARNSAFTRNFLMQWALYSGHRPPGFSSADNGALHVMLLDVTRVKGGNRCAQLYHGLAAPVSDMTSYYNFLACALNALGTPRSWNSSLMDESGLVTVWPPFHFVQCDGVQIRKLASPDVGPVFHHGIKDEQDMLCSYYRDLSKCSLNPHSQVLSGRMPFVTTDSRCTQCIAECVKNFSCLPNEPNDRDAKRRQMRASTPLSKESRAIHKSMISRLQRTTVNSTWHWAAVRLDLDKVTEEVFPSNEGGVSAAKCRKDGS